MIIPKDVSNHLRAKSERRWAGWRHLSNWRLELEEIGETWQKGSRWQWSWLWSVRHFQWSHNTRFLCKTPSLILATRLDFLKFLRMPIKTRVSATNPWLINVCTDCLINQRRGMKTADIITTLKIHAIAEVCCVRRHHRAGTSGVHLHFAGTETEAWCERSQN